MINIIYPSNEKIIRSITYQFISKRQHNQHDENGKQTEVQGRILSNPTDPLSGLLLEESIRSFRQILSSSDFNFLTLKNFSKEPRDRKTPQEPHPGQELIIAWHEQPRIEIVLD